MRNSTKARFRIAKKKQGILLITTLLIISILMILTVGFITVNRDNLVLGEQASDSEVALQAAFGGLHYVMMRFEEDALYGVDPSQLSQANTATTHYDAFPDGTPSALYWNGGGAAIPFSTSYLLIEETGQTVVGYFLNLHSHFQIHFVHNNGPPPADPSLCPGGGGGGYSSQGFDDTTVGSTPANWVHAVIAPNEHSVNNLNNKNAVTVAGKIIPPYTAHIISIGYSHGTTRIVEALLRRMAYTNSSVLSGGDITVRMSPAVASGDGNLYISTLAPLSNSIEAGVSYNGASFVQTGGNINAYAGYNNPIPSGNIQFTTMGTSSGGSNKNLGTGYALRPAGGTIDQSSPGEVSLIDSGSGGTTYPAHSSSSSSLVTSVGVGGGSGTLQAKADNQGPLPPKDLTPSDLLTQLGTSPVTAGGRTVPTTNTFYIPAGVYAFRSGGNSVDVYAPGGNGTPIGTFSGKYNVGGAHVFAVKNYQFMVAPGANLVVDDTIGSATVNSTGSADGNFMMTLSPKDFPSSNNDGSANVLPTLALGYNNANQLGSQMSTLTVGGNVYLQGQYAGNGIVVVESGAGAPGTKTSWIPSSGDFASGSWALNVIQQSSESAPTATAQNPSGNMSVEGNSQQALAPTTSHAVYTDGNFFLNPIPQFSQGAAQSTDGQAFGGAANSFSGGTPGTGGYWSTNIPKVDDTLNDWLAYSDDHDSIETVLRCSNCSNGSLDSASTGVSAAALFGSSTTSDPNLVPYFCSTCTGSAPLPTSSLSLYQYALLSNYKATNDSSWLTYTAPPSSGSLDSVELYIASAMTRYAQQAYSGNQTFGQFFSANATSAYSPQDMTFQGLMYVKGSQGFYVNSGNYRFTVQGAVVTPKGPFELDNAGQANFIYDLSQIGNFYNISTTGNKVTIQWAVVW